MFIQIRDPEVIDCQVGGMVLDRVAGALHTFPKRPRIADRSG